MESLFVRHICRPPRPQHSAVNEGRRELLYPLLACTILKHKLPSLLSSASRVKNRFKRWFRVFSTLRQPCRPMHLCSPLPGGLECLQYCRWMTIGEALHPEVLSGVTNHRSLRERKIQISTSHSDSTPSGGPVLRLHHIQSTRYVHVSPPMSSLLGFSA